MDKGHVVGWVQIYSVPEWWLHQGKKRGWWIDAAFMLSAKPVGAMLWSGVDSVGQV